MVMGGKTHSNSFPLTSMEESKGCGISEKKMRTCVELQEGKKMNLEIPYPYTQTLLLENSLSFRVLR